jgi:hypothetical protein
MNTLFTFRQTFRHGGRSRWIHFSHSGRQSGMEADGYTLHMQADIQACRQMATHVSRHAGMQADGYTCEEACRHGGRWLRMQVDIQAWRQMATHGGPWL